MNDETKTTETAPPPEPLPQVGGSYRREKDGSLTAVEGPGTLPEYQPNKPDYQPTQE